MIFLVRCLIKPVAVTLMLLALIVSAAYAQHPIDVQRAAARRDYLTALTTYDKMPKRITTPAATWAAADSAWALGLPERALQEYDRTLSNEKLGPTERARLVLSKGIIEFQEGRYQVALLHAERAVGLLPEGPLRSKSWMLWGESLARIGSYGAAEDKYIKAVAEASPEDLPEVHFALGMCRVKLGKYDDARQDFENVPLQHERAAQAIRELAWLGIETGNMEHASFWLTRGRSDYPESFLDSWVDYALVKVAISKKDIQEVQRLKTEAEQKYPPSDLWLTLLQAAAEAYHWRVVHEE